ncbi:ATP-binding protein [Planctomyces sp. SH-PL62]|uniref:PAS domain-containing sensor histidine kinase n=1 Tax=Planctomyces sp. SH-PL62 TaxID=1636152 RepID=UPI00078EBE16|nr:ATP-binding protein [Planctomyces sp. SH-PL62]AMV36511.1 Sensor protein ZraS [Planctomyces sp. SH-PL62]
MGEFERKSTPPIILVAVAATAAGLGGFAIERLGRVASDPGSTSHAWHLIAIQGLILAVLCMTGVALWHLRRRDEAEASGAGLLAVLEAAPNGVALIDGSCRVVLVNARVESMFGYHRDELLGRPIEILLPEAAEFLCRRAAPEAPPVLRRDLGAIRGLETQGRLKGGGTTPVAVSLGIVELRDAPVAACIVHDLSDRLREEARLRDAYRALRFANARLRGVVEGTTDQIAALDRDRRFILLNTAYKSRFAALFGREIEQGMRLDDALAGRTDAFARLAARWDRALAGERFQTVVAYPDADGGVIHLELTYSPIRDDQGDLLGASQMVRDVTDRIEADEALRRNAAQLEALGASREKAYAALQAAYDELKQAEGQLVQAEKLSALGQLIAGVAHEINNPLAFVGNDLAILQRDVAGLVELVRLYQQAGSTLADRHPELAAEIDALADRMDLEYSLESLESLTNRAREGLGRIRRIVKDLRDFARLDGGDLEEADLNAGIATTLSIIAGPARDRQVEVAPDLQELPAVTCSPGKINQVVLNLLINAIDASPPGSSVTLRTRPHGDGVTIEVIDQGVGIAPDFRRRIFDPFFTTKPVGKGTGLGLSISYGIIQDHGGRIEVESAPGEGSHFTVFLPLSPPRKVRLPVEAAPVSRDDA